MSDLADPIFSRPAVHVEAGRAVYLRSASAETRRTNTVARSVWVGCLNATFTLASLPVLLAVALLLIVLNPFLNPGRLLFRQERVGCNGRVFRIYKFRTMTEAGEGPATTSIAESEARITKLGAVLRKFRIDELPNFINVVLGDMNVVGPRPDAREQAEVYARTVHGYRDRFDVKPGITGLAQVMHGYAACQESTRKKVRYDRFYVRHRDAGLDLFVVLRTVQVMRTGFGSR